MSRDPAQRPASPSPPSRLVRYERLMSLTVRHEFYGLTETCNDFTIIPTAATQTLLRNLRLIAKPRRGGIDILYHTGQAAALVRHLQAGRDHHAHGASSAFDQPRLRTASWTRLTFLFTLDNPAFASFTDMPLTARPGDCALYLSNHALASGTADAGHGQANHEQTRHEHHAGPRQLAVDWSQLVPMQEVNFSPAYISIATPQDATQVLIYDTSGRAIVIAERVAAAASAPPPAPSGPSRHPHRIGFVPGQTIYLDMSDEHAGRYSYSITTDRAGPEIAFLYPGLQTIPLLLADLFLDTPQESSLSGLPISLPERLPGNFDNDAAARYITPVDYDIHFQARQTIWSYFVVLPAGSLPIRHLALEAGSKELPAFDGPHTVTLPGGRTAHQFTAQAPCALRSHPDFTLRLRGANDHDGDATRILLDRLPLPSAELSGLPPAAGEPARSDIYVYL